MITLTVELGARSYPIMIGNGLLGRSGLLDPYLDAGKILIVSNDVVAPIYLGPVSSMLTGRELHSIELPDGEANKTLAVAQTILDALVEHRFSRDDLIITLGGGVVGDMGGFVAAIYQRGIRFIQVPTSLLAQVDSAVGGKTGVNHPGGKNLIGAFHQPSAVLIDTDSLRSLPDRELSAGLAEVVKYGLIADAELFDWLEHQAEALLRRDAATLNHAIRRSCEIKAAIVAEDELERGRRALLNLGHTFGHAIEQCAGYGQWLHGEAVAAGICLAARFSQRLGMLDDGSTRRIAALLERLKLPTQPPDISAQDFLAAMSLDKKVIAGEIRLVLLNRVGDGLVTPDYPSHELLDMLREQFIH